MDCGPFLAQYTEGAVRQGKVSELLVDYALANTMTVQMRLGMFDGDPSRQPFGNLGPGDVCTPAHQNLALEAALQGIVLLKNDRRVLPLSPSRYRTVAVIGPNSDATVTMIGNYAGRGHKHTTVPLLGLCWASIRPGLTRGLLTIGPVLCGAQVCHAGTYRLCRGSGGTRGPTTRRGASASPVLGTSRSTPPWLPRGRRTRPSW